MTVQKNLKVIRISEIWLDYELYPRQKVLESNVQYLQDELERIGKLDAIVVAEIQGREGYGLVDGAHRREVYLRKGIKTVEAEDLGLLTKKEFLKEAWERNTHGPMQLSVTDRRLAAEKMVKLGMGFDEVHALTGFTNAFLKSLQGIVYKDTEGHLSHIPQALTTKDRESGIITLKQGITQSEVQRHADVVEKIPRHFAPKAALRHLNSLLDYNWFDIVKDDETRRQAKRLYQKLGEVFGND